MIKAPIGLQELRRRIYRKAKSDKTHRFWGLFVHMTKAETLEEAYRIAKRNGGAPGIDGQTFADIESAGLAMLSCGDTGRPHHRQVQTSAEPPGGDPEGQRQSPDASNSLYPRPRGARGTEADSRSYLRGGLLPELLWISTQAVATPCPCGSQAQCAAADVHGASMLICRATSTRFDIGSVGQDCARGSKTPRSCTS